MPALTGKHLSRTLSRPRWPEYRQLLSLALAHGYTLVSLESWLAAPELATRPAVMVVRHDVDQHPASAPCDGGNRGGARNNLNVVLPLAHASAPVISAIRDAGQFGRPALRVAAAPHARRGTLTSADATALLRRRARRSCGASCRRSPSCSAPSARPVRTVTRACPPHTTARCCWARTGADYGLEFGTPTPRCGRTHAGRVAHGSQPRGGQAGRRAWTRSTC